MFRLLLQFLVLLQVSFLYQTTYCMDRLKSLAHRASEYVQDYKKNKEKQYIEQAFQALASNDLKTLVKLVSNGRVGPFSVNEAGMPLITKLLKMQNHHAIFPLFFGRPDDPSITDISNIRELLCKGPNVHMAMRGQDDTQPLTKEEILSFVICLTVQQLPFTLKELCTYTPGMINKAEYGTQRIPYLHEQVWLKTCAVQERMAAQDPQPADEAKAIDLIHKQTYFLLAPYLSPRAFESLTNYAQDPERDLPKTTAFAHQKYTEWKAMSKERNALITQWIVPSCVSIVREYLEGIEYQAIDGLLCRQFAERRETTEIHLYGERKYLHEYLIMEYIGGQEYLTALRLSSLYNIMFQKLYQRFEVTGLNKVVSHESIGRPTQLIMDYCEQQ